MTREQAIEKARAAGFVGGHGPDAWARGYVSVLEALGVLKLDEPPNNPIDALASFPVSDVVSVGPTGMVIGEFGARDMIAHLARQGFEIRRVRP